MKNNAKARSGRRRTGFFKALGGILLSPNTDRCSMMLSDNISYHTLTRYYKVCRKAFFKFSN